MTQTMTRDLEQLLARQVAEGNYRCFGEALAALKSVITDQRLLEKVRAAWLQREIADGDASGGEIPAEDVFAAARERI